MDFPQYTTDYISGVMSLRKPQSDSLKILEKIVNGVPPRKNADLDKALESVRAMYPICTAFERDFMSLTFALATGVGKTRLMGAFITYLYTRHGIRNFFVVAPGTTVYDKLKNDLGNPSNPKYVFKGLDCFSVSIPRIIADDDYRYRQLSIEKSDINIFIFNIDKFNKESAKMRAVNEYLGESFYEKLARMDDLVLIMDESHHYRAERGAAALNELRPVLGLELTATPLVTKGAKQIPFKNVVYEYPLSRAIEDGFTRTPFAVTREDIDFYNFGDEQLDKMMLNDGILLHENARAKLAAYAKNNDAALVKPFMLVVCKDTEHAAWVEKYVKSDKFMNGAYRDKTITVHSKMKGAESEQNLKLLLDVERSNNPIEIVIHVNMLKEGWDVNNLYTIVPLRTAASKILREQMVGRGLRLPYGERVGDRELDAVMLTAHDKFNEILEEAKKGNSIFKAGNVIKVEDVQPPIVITTQINLKLEDDKDLEEAYKETGIEKNENNDALLKDVGNKVEKNVSEYLANSKNGELPEKKKKEIVGKTIKQVKEENKNLGKTFEENADALYSFVAKKVDKRHKEALNKCIPIPQVKILDNKDVGEYAFSDFDLDLSGFNHKPIENNILIQNLHDSGDVQRIKGNFIDFDGYEPKRVILFLLREKPEIDYEKCSELLYKLITQACGHYAQRFGNDGMMNIVMMYKREIADNIYNQMLRHFSVTDDSEVLLFEGIESIRRFNFPQTYNCSSHKNLFDNFDGNIQSVVFENIKYGVFNCARFDSRPELTFARVLEKNAGIGDVKNWLRPAMKEFNIFYTIDNNRRQYVPDFVVETEDTIYLVEVKGEDKINDPDVIAKKKCALKYCEIATNWGNANGYKDWKYLFIPSKQVMANSSFLQLAGQFLVDEN